MPETPNADPDNLPPALPPSEPQPETNPTPPANRSWNWDHIFKTIPILISTLSLGIAFKAIQNTRETIQIQQDQFEYSTRPFIELTNIRVDSTAAGQRPITSYSITNKGKFPASIIEFKVFTGYAGRDANPDAIIQNAEASPPKENRFNVGIIPFAQQRQIRLL